jgi:hypothetical protein
MSRTAMMRRLDKTALVYNAIIMPSEAPIFVRTRSLMLFTLTLVACRAGSVDVNVDDGITIDESGEDASGDETENEEQDDEDDSEDDSSDGGDGDDPDDDEDRPDDDEDDDDRPDEEDDDPDDDEEGETYEGYVEITFEGDESTFCEGDAWFYIDSSKLYGEGACELQAGPGAGETANLYFNGEPRGRNYEGEVYSDWSPPEGGGMPDADFEAQVGESFLKIEWESTVPIPDGGGNVDVVGYGQGEF